MFKTSQMICKELNVKFNNKILIMVISMILVMMPVTMNIVIQKLQ